MYALYNGTIYLFLKILPQTKIYIGAHIILFLENGKVQLEFRMKASFLDSSLMVYFWKKKIISPLNEK